MITSSNYHSNKAKNHYASIPLSGAFAYVVKVLFNLQTYASTVRNTLYPYIVWSYESVWLNSSMGKKKYYW